MKHIIFLAKQRSAYPSLHGVGVIPLRYCFDGVDGGFCKSPDESSSWLTVVSFFLDL